MLITPNNPSKEQCITTFLFSHSLKVLARGAEDPKVYLRLTKRRLKKTISYNENNNNPEKNIYIYIYCSSSPWKSKYTDVI